MFWTGYVIGMLVVGGVCAYIASEKGRSAGLWFLSGCAVGIFALIAVIAVPSRKDQ